MAGVKGRTGRLPGAEIANRDFSLLIKKSYNYLMRYFNTFDQPIKTKIALEIIKKAMPQQVNVDAEITHLLAQKVQDGRIRAGDVQPSRN